jgi:LysM repeat protein
MKCPNCGATFRGGRGRCPACGFRVEVKKLVRRCPVCRARVAEGAKTCLMCGAPLEGERGLLPRVSLSMVPPAPLLGIVVAAVLVAGIWFLKPWRSIQIRPYNTATPTMTASATATPTIPPTATATAPPTSTPTPETVTYIVRRGDTLSLIAAQFDVTIEAIAELNGLDGNMIQVGQELLIPTEPAPSEATPAPQGTPAPAVTGSAETTTYTVRAGDTLTEIAARFNVSVESIMQANNISDPDSIREGQELVIPVSATPVETPGIGGPPTPTAASHLVYEAPLLLGPPDGQEFRDEQAELPILLNWLSVGILGEDEWYAVTVRGTEPAGEEWETVEFTKANSYRVAAELRPPAGAPSHGLEWEVRVVQLTETEGEDGPDVSPIGRKSETRTFYWY